MSSADSNFPSVFKAFEASTCCACSTFFVKIHKGFKVNVR